MRALRTTLLCAGRSLTQTRAEKFSFFRGEARSLKHYPAVINIQSSTVSFTFHRTLEESCRFFSSSLEGGRGGSGSQSSANSFHYPSGTGNSKVFEGSSSIPQGLEMQRGHHLQSSVGLHSSILTACGRSFDPQVYYEVLQACCDPQWMSAIQRELRTDTEYADFLRSNGGVASEVRAITENVHHDDELMRKLKDRLKVDKGISLSLCAIQDSYLRIRKKRDQHETQVAADGGRDPYATMKERQRDNFGAQQPKFQ